MSQIEGARTGATRFSRAARLTRPSEFRRVFEGGRRVSDRYFVLVACENGERPARLGLAISKRCASRAVDRNRLKRVVRESFRSQRLRLTGFDLVVMCRRGAVGATRGQLHASIAAHWDSILRQPCAAS